MPLLQYALPPQLPPATDSLPRSCWGGPPGMLLLRHAAPPVPPATDVFPRSWWGGPPGMPLLRYAAPPVPPAVRRPCNRRPPAPGEHASRQPARLHCLARSSLVTGFTASSSHSPLSSAFRYTHGKGRRNKKKGSFVPLKPIVY